MGERELAITDVLHITHRPELDNATLDDASSSSSSSSSGPAPVPAAAAATAQTHPVDPYNIVLRVYGRSSRPRHQVET